MIKSNENIILNIGKRIVKVAVHEILYIVCEDYVCSLTMTDGRTFHVSRTLQSFHEELNQHEFHYLRRDVLVNLHHVTGIQSTSARKWCAHISDGSVFDIAARRQKGFKESFVMARSTGK